MKLNEIATEQHIVLVCGNIACGKGTYCKQMFPGFVQLTVSDIVKQLSRQTERSELGKTAHLDEKISQALIQRIEELNPADVIVDGIRQVSILLALEHHFGTAIMKIVWLDVPEDVRRQRFAGRKDAKDNMDYDTSMASDRGLGIDDVEHYIRTNHTVEPF